MTERSERIKRGREARHQKKRVWLIVLIVILALILAIVGAAYGALKYYHSLLDYQPEEVETTVAEIETESEEMPSESPASEDEIASLEQQLEENAAANLETETETAAAEDPLVNVYNLLVAGVDSRSNNFSGRTDTMIVLSINQETSKIVATSLLRDTFCTIPGKGTNRLNVAYSYGGMSLLKDTIQANYGIRVDRCVVVNFKLVEDFIDYLGGVDVHINPSEAMWLKLPEGTNGYMHLNGKLAVEFARIRKVDGRGDFGRTERQREVLLQCFQLMRGLGLGDLNNLAHEFLPRVRTDLSETDCLYLLSLLPKALGYEMEMLSLPISGTYENKNIRGMSVLSVDFAANTQAWMEKVLGTTE